MNMKAVLFALCCLVFACSTRPAPKPLGQRSTASTITVGGGRVVHDTTLRGNGSNPSPLSVSTSVIQSRVTGTCSTGNAIRVIASDGSVTCQGIGVQGAGTSGDLAVWGTSSTLTTYAGSGLCTAGEAITEVDASGAKICSVFFDTAGAGLTGSGRTVSLNHPTKTCAAGTHFGAVDSGGNITCTSDTTGVTGPSLTQYYLPMQTGPTGAGSLGDSTIHASSDGSLFIRAASSFKSVAIGDSTTQNVNIGASSIPTSIKGDVALGSSWSNSTAVTGQPKCSGTTTTVTGTGATVVGTNCSGTITLASAIASVTLNFDASAAWTNTPPCNVTWVDTDGKGNDPVWIHSQSPTADVIDLTTANIGAINYVCWGR